MRGCLLQGIMGGGEVTQPALQARTAISQVILLLHDVCPSALHLPQLRGMRLDLACNIRTFSKGARYHPCMQHPVLGLENWPFPESVVQMP